MLRVQVEPQALEVAPGASGVVRARAVNGAPQVEEYAVDVVGADPAWVRVDPPRVSLLPGGEASVDITLAIPRERPPAAGTRVFGIRYRPAGEGEGQVEEVLLTIAGAPAAELVVEPQQVSGGAAARIRAQVVNTGNTALEIALSGEDPERAVAVTVTPPTLALRPGEQQQVRIDLRAPRGWTGPEVVRPVLVRGRGGPTELTAGVTFTQRSRLSSGLRRGAVGLVGVALVGGSILAAQLLVGDDPVRSDAAGLGALTQDLPSPSPSGSIGAVAPAPPPDPGAQPSADDAGTATDTGQPSPEPEPEPGNPFLGSWRQVAPTTGPTHLEILDSGTADLPVVQASGCALTIAAPSSEGVTETPADTCDWGPAQGEVIGDGLFVQWDQDVALRTMTITEIAADRLLVQTFSDYTDGRESSLSEDTFVRA